MSAKKKPFWQYAPDELAAASEQAAMFRVLAGKECQRHIELFERHGNPINLWKAWGCVRACGPILPEVIGYFTPHFDKLAAIELESGTPARAKQREDRDWILRDYYAERELSKGARSLTKIYARVAARHNTTAGGIEQLVLHHEGRDGRSKTSRSAKKNG